MKSLIFGALLSQNGVQPINLPAKSNPNENVRSVIEMIHSLPELFSILPNPNKSESSNAQIQSHPHPQIVAMSHSKQSSKPGTESEPEFKRKIINPGFEPEYAPEFAPVIKNEIVKFKPGDDTEPESESEFEVEADPVARSKRSGFLDAESLYRQAEMFMQPDALKRFKHFYREQVDSNDRYGCHCQMKDLVSQDYIDYEYEEKMKKQFPYSGTPVDDLDRACHNHRECLRCATMELGCANDGISEHFLDYSLNRMGMCNDRAGTCQRAYCECAQQFVEDLNSNAIFRYSPEQFSKKAGNFEPNEDSCTRHVETSLDDISTNQDLGFSRMDSSTNQIQEKKKRNLGCCSRSNKGDAPWRLYNIDRYQCCEDGSVKVSC
jgi:hypothetical protein